MGTSSAPRPATKFRISRHALSQVANGIPGEHGAVALKAFETLVGGVKCKIAIGDVIPKKVIAIWPLQNRRSMETTGYVRYFLTPTEAAEAGL